MQVVLPPFCFSTDIALQLREPLCRKAYHSTTSAIWRNAPSPFMVSTVQSSPDADSCCWIYSKQRPLGSFATLNPSSCRFFTCLIRFSIGSLIPKRGDGALQGDCSAPRILLPSSSFLQPLGGHMIATVLLTAVWTKVCLKNGSPSKPSRRWSCVYQGRMMMSEVWRGCSK